MHCISSSSYTSCKTRYSWYWRNGHCSIRIFTEDHISVLLETVDKLFMLDAVIRFTKNTHLHPSSSPSCLLGVISEGGVYDWLLPGKNIQRLARLEINDWTWLWPNCILGDLNCTLALAELCTRWLTLAGLCTGWLCSSWNVYWVTKVWLNCILGDLDLAELHTRWLCSGWTVYWLTWLWLNCVPGDIAVRLAELYNAGWLGSGWTAYWVAWL